MISVILTAANESATVGKAVMAMLPQLANVDEILVVSPDVETQNAAKAIGDDRVRLLQDSGLGKPAALNQALKSVQGDLVVLTDGDVVVEAEALTPLLQPFVDPRVGLVTGRPMSVNPDTTKYGYWALFLTEVAHFIRLNRHVESRFLEGSGYLMAFRRDLIKQIDEDVLAEDAMISHRIAEQGFVAAYAPEARVKVRYPTNFDDWIKQKVRSTGGFAQKQVTTSPLRMRSFGSEVVNGLRFALTFPKNLTQVSWLTQLFMARLYVWLLVFLKVRLMKQSVQQLWQRVESTK